MANTLHEILVVLTRTVTGTSLGRKQCGTGAG